MNAMRNVAVRCRDLIKTYGAGDGRVEALRGVDLDVFSGELLMLVGPSGCGKTTLVSIITAISGQDSGQCEVFGKDLNNMAEPRRTSVRGSLVGFVFQTFKLLPALTALENVSLPLLVNGTPRKMAETRAMAVLETVGLHAKAHVLPGHLSGGQQQRVAIGRALVHDPKLIVCDEPTSSLDSRSGHNVMEVLREVVRAPERALIVVTHDPRIVEFSDRIAHMQDGRIVDGDLAQRPERPA